VDDDAGLRPPARVVDSIARRMLPKSVGSLLAIGAPLHSEDTRQYDKRQGANKRNGLRLEFLYRLSASVVDSFPALFTGTAPSHPGGYPNAWFR
jgi:hypothetical protein